MSISTSDLNTLGTIPQTTAQPNASSDAVDSNVASGTDGAQTTKLTPEIAKQQLNASIMQASLQISISSQNDSLPLVYKTAIENLNEILATTRSRPPRQRQQPGGDRRAYSVIHQRRFCNV